MAEAFKSHFFFILLNILSTIIIAKTREMMSNSPIKLNFLEVYAKPGTEPLEMNLISNSEYIALLLIPILAQFVRKRKTFTYSSI